MQGLFCRPSTRLLTWAVLFCFVQTLFPHRIFANSPWVNKHRKPDITNTEVSPMEPIPEGTTDSTVSPPTETPTPSENSSSNVSKENSSQSNSPLWPKETDPRSNLSGTNLKPKSFNKFSLPLVAALEIYSDSVSYAGLKEISNTFRREIKNTGKYLVYSRSEMRKAMMKDLNQELAVAKQIDEYVSQARKLYDDFKWDSAAAIMKEAMAAIGSFDATPAVAEKISEAYLTQALILDAQEKEKETNTAFLNAAALHSTRQLEPSLYAPSVIARFYKAKTEFPKIKEGALRIETDPPVAKIIVADKERGKSPATIKGLPLGIQKVTILKEGFDPYEKNIMVVANSENSYLNKVSITLNRQGESTSLDPLLGELVSIKDYDLQINKMADVGKLLFADQLFAARLEKGDKVYHLYLVAVDTHTGKEIGRAYQEVAPDLADVDVSIAHALRDLLSGKTPERWTQRIAIEGKGGHYLSAYNKQKPFYKKWPFLTLISVLAAGGAAGAAVVFTRPKSAVDTVQ